MVLLQSMESWFAHIGTRLYATLIEADRYKMILSGLGQTLTIALFATLLGILIGTMVAFLKLSKLKILRGIATCYVGLIRGTPVVVQLLIIYHVILSNAPVTRTQAAIICFSINSAAYVSEMIRAGILSVEKGQTEAGRSLGLSGASTMLLIVMPQAMKVAIPSLFNEFVMLLKETSIVGMIGLMDLTKSSDYIKSRTFEYYTPLLVVAAIYLVIVLSLTFVFGKIERRLRQSDHG